MSRARLAALSVVVLGALTGAQTALADDPTLYVKYTMGCTFTLTGDNGAPISVIPPGHYQVLVTTPQAFGEIDLSGVSDPTVACGGFVSFHMTGPGVSLHTTLDDGDGLADQLQVTIQAGSYTVFDDSRPTTRLTFTSAAGAAGTGGGSVSTGGGSPPKPTQPNAPAIDTKNLAGTLNGSVDTKGKLTLTLKGKNVSSLKAGKYRLSVIDETSKSGFSIQRLGKSATNVTSVKLVGKKTVTLTLAAGQWYFYSPGKKKTPFIVHS